MNMSDLLEKLFRDSIDMDAVLEDIRDSSVRSYRNLYNIQRSMTGMQRYDIPLTDFKTINRLPKEKQKTQYPIRYIYTLGIDIVSGDREYRFKESGLQNVPLTLFQIASNANFFKNNFIAYVGGKMVATLKFLITESETSILFELDKGVTPNDYMTGVSRDTFETWVANNEVLHLIVVPNYSIDYADINKPTLELNNGIVEASKFVNNTEFKSGSTFFFINTTEEDAIVDFVRCNILGNSVEVPTQLYQNSSVKLFRLYGISFNLLYDIKLIDSTSDWFILGEDFELPLPKENIMIFIKTSDGYAFDSDVSIDLYYPNVYHVNNLNGREAALFMFYADNTLDSKYINDLYILKMAYSNLIDKYKSQSLPDIVYNYEPVRVDLFDNDDFESSVFFPDQKNLYNIDRLQNYITEDPKFLVKYLYYKLTDNQKYFISAAKLDLPTRIRYNSNTECSEIGNKITFTEEMYLINLRKQFVGTDSYEFRVFVDNLCVRPSEYVLLMNKDFYLFYIPSRLIKSTSIIEIEKYLEVRSTQILSIEDISNYVLDDDRIAIQDTLSSKGVAFNVYPIKMSLPPNVSKFDSYNINMIQDDSMFIDPSMYRIVIYNDIVEGFVEISGEGHYVIDRDYYIIMDDSYIGKNVTFLLNTFGSFYKYDIADYADTIHYEDISSEPRLRGSNMRVYKNGYTLPKNRYFVAQHEYNNTPAKAIIGCEVKPGDIIEYETLPVEFVTEYSEAIIDEKGYIDTKDFLSSPFDLKWYDVYLNGKKLNKTQIDIISCSRFFVKNVDSRRNLHVVKRNAIQDSFSIKVENDITNKLIDVIEDLLPNLKKDRDIIGDTAENIIGDDAPDIFSHMMFVELYLEFIFINPNKKQLNSIIKAEFPNLFNDYDILTLETNVNPDAEYITSIDSNIRRQYMKRGQYRYSFTPLHIGNHSDAMDGEYLCDPITGLPGMKTSNGEIISSGLLNRLSSHRDRLNTKLAFNGMTTSSIYQLEFDANTTGTREAVFDLNLLDGDVDIVAPNGKIMLSFDMDILEKGTDDIMFFSQYDPIIDITYEVTGTGATSVYTSHVSTMSESPIILNDTDLTIKSIVMKNDGYVPATIKCILYSILIAF